MLNSEVSQLDRGEIGTTGLLRAVVRGAPIILWSVDTDGIFTVSEGRALAGLGLKPGEAVGQSFFDMFANNPEMIARLRAALTGETQHGTTRIGEHFYETWEFPVRNTRGGIEGVFGVSTDVTDRVRAELERGRSEELFQTVFAAGAVGILLVTEREGRVLEVNEECLRIFERPRDEVINRTTVDLGIWASVEQRLHWNRSVLDRGETYTRLHRITTGTGKQRVIRYWGRMVTLPSGTCVVSLMYDATAEVVLKQRLRRSRRLYRILARSAPVGIFSSTSANGWKYVNDRLCNLAGCSREHLLGQRWLDLIHPADRQRISERWLAAGSSWQPFREEFRFQHAIGHDVWVYVEAQPKEPAASLTTVWVGTATDITRRCVAEQQLREVHETLEQRFSARTREIVQMNASLRTESAQRLEALRALQVSETRWRTLVVNAPDYILQVDLSGHIEFINRQNPAIALPNVIGMSIFDFVPPEHIDDVRGAMETARQTGIPESRTFPVNGAHGVNGWYSSVYVPVLDGDRVTSFLISSRDITQERQAEAELSQLRLQVAHAGRVSAAGEMTAAIAHELNQPLLAIANYAAGCIHRLASGQIAHEQLVERLAEIQAAANRGGEIIRRLRGFVERPDDEKKRTSLRQLIQDAIRLTQPQLTHRNIRCQTTVESRLPKVIVDQIQIVQVIVNLVLNATEAMDETPARERILQVTGTRDGSNGVRCAVRDSGRGLPLGLGESIFDPFVSTKPSGMGIGLSISRSIVESHGGRIECAPNEGGKGVTFSFVLPIADESD